jgi:hypothetical protein
MTFFGLAFGQADPDLELSRNLGADAPPRTAQSGKKGKRNRKVKERPNTDETMSTGTVPTSKHAGLNIRIEKVFLQYSSN